jgi:hypothetical protein
MTQPTAFTTTNTPNAARVTQSMRKLGYDNVTAIADLIDNSLDAGASVIKVRVLTENKQPKIFIADDGSGMTKTVLDEAMKFGSESKKDETSDLGKFGMGLSTASLSIAKRCTVITITDGVAYTAITDVDEIFRQNAFVKYLEPSTDAEVALFKEQTGGTEGTLVILENCDQLTNLNTTSFADRLCGELGRIFRYYLDSGRVIQVNNRTVAAVDPLQWNDHGTQRVLSDEIIEIEHEGTTHKLHLRLAVIPQKSASDAETDANMRNQGLYILRNNREIEQATWLGLGTKHNDFNRVRGELLFDGGLDDVIGLNFTKRGVNLTQSVQDKLARVLKPELLRIRREVKAERQVTSAPDQQKVLDSIAAFISSKDHLLMKPKREHERRQRLGGVPTPKPPRSNHKGGEHVNINDPKLAESKLKYVFVTEKLGIQGQIYEAEMSGGKLVISLNVEHPFYEKFIAGNMVENGEGLKNVHGWTYLICSLAQAEVSMTQDDENEIVGTMKMYMANNMRALLR